MSFGALEGDHDVAAFVLGKLPAHGDFISRGLDDEAVEAADAVLAEAITLAALRWDYRWDDVYVETPVWRFVAAPGVLAREWVAGVFLPSVDAVGRQFPLLAGFSAQTLALIADAEALASALHDAEQAARTALIEGYSVDRLLQTLEEITSAFVQKPERDPGMAFAASALRRAEGASWTVEAVFWVAGAEGIDPVAVSGALGAEALSGLFLLVPQARDEAASPQGESPERNPELGEAEREEAGRDVAALEDSKQAEAVISSGPPADAA